MKLIKGITAIFTSAIIFLSAMPILSFANDVTTDIDSISAEIMEFAEKKKEEYPSFAVAIFEGNEVLYSDYFGYVDKENNILADEESVYEWGSITKLVTWVSVMQLAEQGKLDLNEDIRTYLPEKFFKKLKYDEPITMMNLMNHTAGWQESCVGVWTTEESEIRPLDEALKYSEPAQIFHSGDTVAYSNYGTAVAGYVVECVSGMDYTQYVHENIFEPLGMEHTSIAVDYSDNEWVKNKRFTQKSYEFTGKELESLGSAVYYLNLYPCGSAMGTLSDITKFAQALADDNSSLFEKSETMKLMKTTTKFYGDSNIPMNSHGLWTLFYGENVIGHDGGTLGYSSNLIFNDDTKKGVVVLTNQTGAMFPIGEIPEIVFGDSDDNPLFSKSEITINADISGIYKQSRAAHRGILSVATAVGGVMPVISTDDSNKYSTIIGLPVERIADKTYLMDYDGFKMLMYSKTNSEGKLCFELTSCEYIKNDMGLFEIILLFSIIIFTVIYIVTIIVKLICLIIKRKKPTKTAVFTVLGQLSMAAVTMTLYSVSIQGNRMKSS